MSGPDVVKARMSMTKTLISRLNTKMTSGNACCSMQNCWWPHGFPMEVILGELQRFGWVPVSGPAFGSMKLSWPWNCWKPAFKLIDAKLVYGTFLCPSISERLYLNNIAAFALWMEALFRSERRKKHLPMSRDKKTCSTWATVPFSVSQDSSCMSLITTLSFMMFHVCIEAVDNGWPSFSNDSIACQDSLTPTQALRRSIKRPGLTHAYSTDSLNINIYIYTYRNSGNKIKITRHELAVQVIHKPTGEALHVPVRRIHLTDEDSASQSEYTVNLISLFVQARSDRRTYSIKWKRIESKVTVQWFNCLHPSI